MPMSMPMPCSPGCPFVLPSSFRDDHSIIIALYDKESPCRGEASFVRALHNQRTENSIFVYEYVINKTAAGRTKFLM